MTIEVDALQELESEEEVAGLNFVCTFTCENTCYITG
ncbi:ALQxL family class IV lanthipeptide [Kitasatospora sp. NBC_01266]|nr:ALQxL family class IV lanthipeptide [Kitasatospora sp. NBC_01266]